MGALPGAVTPGKRDAPSARQPPLYRRYRRWLFCLPMSSLPHILLALSRVVRMEVSHCRSAARLAAQNCAPACVAALRTLFPVHHLRGMQPVLLYAISRAAAAASGRFNVWTLSAARTLQQRRQDGDGLHPSFSGGRIEHHGVALQLLNRHSARSRTGRRYSTNTALALLRRCPVPFSRRNKRCGIGSSAARAPLYAPDTEHRCCVLRANDIGQGRLSGCLSISQEITSYLAWRAHNAHLCHAHLPRDMGM